MCSGAICGASRGAYSKPVPVLKAGINWLDEDDNSSTMPDTYACEHSKHWEWGNGTRNGQKLYYPTKEMFFQCWDLNEEEMQEAIDQFDMFSLDMPSKIICIHCAEHE